MTRLIALLLLLMLCLSSALADGISFTDIEPDKEYVIRLEQVLHISPQGHTKRLYYVAQGSCTDGQYAYIATLNKMVNKVGIWKMNLSDWSEANMVYNLDLGHANDLAVNTKNNLLYAVYLDNPYSNVLVALKPDTLEIVENIPLNFSFYALSYNESRDQYAFGLGGSYDIVITDGDFNYVKLMPGVNTGLTRQGMDSDDKYIYFPHWDYKNYKSQLMVYDWDGNYINTIKIDNYMEVESMFHVGDDYYFTFLSNSPKIFKATLEEVTQ